MKLDIGIINPIHDPSMVRSIVSVYRETFGGEPWNEGWLCPLCGAIFPLKDKLGICGSCVSHGKKVLLTEYWPVGKVTSDLYHEMSKPGALCCVAKNRDRVIGFAWGYKISTDAKLDNYLEAPGLHDLMAGDFFYLDETAVLPQYQGRGIGKKLMASIFSHQSDRRVLLRTLDGSHMLKLVNYFGGKTIMNISRKRVIMIIGL